MRQALKEHLEDAFGDGYAIYEAGVDLIKTPCIVINPANPYIVPVTMGKDARVQKFIDLWLVTNRTSPADSLNHLEEMRKVAAQAVKEFLPRGRWTTFGKLGAVDVGGVMSATGVLECVFVSDDN